MAWAHRGRYDCDPWAEGESWWHVQWKDLFPQAYREVAMGPHRADIALPSSLAIELQHSYIDPAGIREREDFYRRRGGMMWVFDVTGAADNILLRKRDGFYSFRWKWPRWHIASTRVRTILDFGDGTLLDLKKVHNSLPCGGWGYLPEKDAFVEDLQKVKTMTLKVGSDPREEVKTMTIKVGRAP